MKICGEHVIAWVRGCGVSKGLWGSSDGRERWYRYDGIFQGKRAGGEPKHMLGNAENRVVPFAEWRALGEKLPKTGSG